MKPSVITIATRKSPLALWQSEFIKRKLISHHPHLTVDLMPFSTKGDEILDKSLAKIGGKGLFIKELEKALQEELSDLAVHSMKDMPAQMPDGFKLAAILPRANASDAFVSNQYRHPSELPEGAVVGTSSLRRQSQLLRAYPHLKVEPLRGNVGTRLDKLDSGMYSAILLASAGLERLGLKERIRYEFSIEEMLPAVAQSVLGIEISEHNERIMPFLRVLNDRSTATLVAAERACAARLNASCQSALGVFAQPVKDAGSANLHLQAVLLSPDGKQCLRAEQVGNMNEATVIGQAVAEQLLAQGGQSLL